MGAGASRTTERRLSARVEPTQEKLSSNSSEAANRIDYEENAVILELKHEIETLQNTLQATLRQTQAEKATLQANLERRQTELEEATLRIQQLEHENTELLISVERAAQAKENRSFSTIENEVDEFDSTTETNRIDPTVQRKLGSYLFGRNRRSHSFSSMETGAVTSQQAFGISRGLLAPICITRFPLFKDAPEKFINELANGLKEITKAKKEYIITKGEIGKEMFFVIKGKVSVMGAGDNEVVANLSVGSFFGELGVLFSMPRTASVIAATECELFILKKEVLDSVIKDYPMMVSRIKQAAEARSDWIHNLKYKEISEVFGGEFVMDVGRNDLSKLPLFAGAPTDFLSQLAMTMIPEVHPAGSLIINDDEVAKEMYFLVKGTVEVLSADLSKVHAEMSAGSFFGEVGILLNVRRTATIRAKDSVNTLKLEKESLDGIIKNYPPLLEQVQTAAKERYNLFKARCKSNTNIFANESDVEVNKQNLRKLELFRGCDDLVFTELAIVMKRVFYEPEDMIILVHEVAREMFFLTHGEVEILSEYNEHYSFAQAGTYFGEVGILKKVPRIASVKAITPCTCYLLFDEDLESVLDKYPDIGAKVREVAELRLQRFLMREILA